MQLPRLVKQKAVGVQPRIVILVVADCVEAGGAYVRRTVWHAMGGEATQEATSALCGLSTVGKGRQTLTSCRFVRRQ